MTVRGGPMAFPLPEKALFGERKSSAATRFSRYAETRVAPRPKPFSAHRTNDARAVGKSKKRFLKNTLTFSGLYGILFKIYIYYYIFARIVRIARAGPNATGRNSIKQQVMTERFSVPGKKAKQSAPPAARQAVPAGERAILYQRTQGKQARYRGETGAAQTPAAPAAAPDTQMP